jgi:CRP-like cAMP-binding protein
MKNLIGELKLLSLDNTIPAEDQQICISLVKKVEIKKGEVLFQEGEVCTCFYFLDKGLIRLYYYKQDGKEVTEHFASEGEGFGAIESLVEKQPSYLIAEALENSVIYKLNKEQIEQLCMKYWPVEYEFRKLLEIALVSSQKRMRSIQFETANDRYKYLLRHHPHIFQKATSIQIASYLGITPETLSRMKSV